MPATKIMIYQQERIILINPEEIVFCKSNNCYTEICLYDGKRVLAVISLTKFHKELTSINFIRINQSYIINKQYIQSIIKKKRSIELENNIIVPFTISLKELVSKINEKDGFPAFFEKENKNT